MQERLIPTALIVGAKPIQSRYPGLSGQLWQWQEVVPPPLWGCYKRLQELEDRKAALCTLCILVDDSHHRQHGAKCCDNHKNVV